MFPYTEVPQQLKNLPNWVVWKFTTKNGKPDKPPYDAKRNGDYCFAKTDDSTTWAPFSQVLETVDPLNGSPYEGPGFVFTDTNLVGCDLDGVVTNGVINPFALAVMKLANSYCEFSPSGKGVHVIVESTLPLPPGNKKGSKALGGEIYNKTSPKYFTVTGDKIDGYPAEVKKIDNQDTLDLLHFMVLHLHDAKLTRLWMGDSSLWGPGAKYQSQSEADEALCSLLARELNGDARKIEMYFSASMLGQRDKWTDRPDYRERTIKKVLKDQPNAPATSSKSSPEVKFDSVPCSESAIKHILEPSEHRQDGWFDVGGVSLLGGSSGVGKTTLMLELLYRQYQGHLVLGHQTNKVRFHVLTVDRPPEAYDATIRRLGLLPSDIPRTQLPMVHDSEAAQAIFDEVQKMDPTPNLIFVEGLDMLSSNQNDKVKVSIFLRQLQKVAKHLQIALIGSVGASKVKRGQEYGHKRDQISGSEAWGRLADTVVVISFSEEDDGTGDQREMSVLLREASSERFSLQFEGGRLVQIPTTVPQNDRHAGRSDEPRQKAVAFLIRKLRDGGVLLQKLKEDARQEEYLSMPSLYRAADQLGIDREHAEEVKLPNGKTTRIWKLPPKSDAGADYEATL